jgi:excisionase family DNA binding protein
MAELAERESARLPNIETVMARLSLGRSKAFEIIANGTLRSVKVGRRRLVSEAALVDFIEKQRRGSLSRRYRDKEPHPSEL